MNQSWKNLAVGMLVVGIGLSILLGSPTLAGTMFLASIVCTLGIGLAFWIPFCWSVGWMTLAVYDVIVLEVQRRRSTLPGAATPELVPVTPTNTPLSPEQIALVEYMRKGSAYYGWSDTQIATRLRAQGWSDAEIATAQELVRASQN